MSWTRLSDEWTERRTFEDIPFDARWHYLCMVQMCSRKQLWDGRLRMTDALRCSDVPEPAAALQMLAAVEIVRLDGAHVVLVEIEEHVPPPSVRLESERAKIRMRRNRKHKVGDHSDCLPGHCEHATGDVTDEVTRNTGTGRDDTGQAFKGEPAEDDDSEIQDPPEEVEAALKADGWHISSSRPLEPEPVPPARPHEPARPLHHCGVQLDDDGTCGWCA